MAQTADDFRSELRELLSKAEALKFYAVEITAGSLHRRVGGYPGPSHSMPNCCSVMRQEMDHRDSIVSEPEKGAGASLTIRYVLPR